MPSPITGAYPEHSNSTSGARARAVTLARRASTTSVAPISRARASRAGLTSDTTTSVAPKARAVCRLTKPMGPAPVISTREPAVTRPLRQAQMPTDSGSSSAAASSVSYTHLRAHETRHDLVCRLLLEKKKNNMHYPRQKSIQVNQTKLYKLKHK